MGRVAIATAVTRNYISHARVMAGSVHRFHDDIDVYALVVDAVAGEYANDEFHPLVLQDLAAAGAAVFPDRYSAWQVVVAAKPVLMRGLLDRGYDAVVYLDADILVLDDLASLFADVLCHAMLLSPHLPLPARGDGRRLLREAELLTRGIYNGGCVGATTASRDFLEWWGARLSEHCEDRVRDGLHYDQRWLDLAPALVEDLYVNDDPGCNVAYWNLPELEISPGSAVDRLRVNGRPCRFFHFSGYDPREPEVLTRFQPGLRLADFPVLRPLFRHYVDLLLAQGFRETIDTPWRRLDSGGGGGAVA